MLCCQSGCVIRESVPSLRYVVRVGMSLFKVYHQKIKESLRVCFRREVYIFITFGCASC